MCASSELPYLAHLKSLATDMAESVLQRVSDYAASWGWDDEARSNGSAGAEPAVAALRQAAAAEGAAARARLQDRRQKLIAELERKQAEEVAKSAEILAKCKVEYNAALQAQEQKLVEVRRLANCASSDNESAACSVDAAELHSEFVDQIARIQSHLAATKTAISKLEAKRTNLEKIEAKQARSLPSIEAVLAGAVSDGLDFADEEDQALCEAIRKGEQVCKRMRRHLAGA